MISNIKNELKAIVKNTRKIYFSGTCYSITSNNEQGEFDILPQHANIISLVKDYLIVDKASASEKKFLIHQGVLIAKENTVQVFLD